MKLIKTISRLLEDAERNYFLACDNCSDEKTIQKLEKNYYDTLELMKKINKIENNKAKN